MTSVPSELVRSRYARGTVLAALAIAGGWHLVYNLTFTVVSWQQYRWPVLVAVAWLGYALGVAMAGRAGLSGRPPRWPWRWPWSSAGAWPWASAWAWPWLWCLVALATTAAVAAASPGLLLESANWGWGAGGWLAILALWRRPMRELVAFQAVAAALSLGALVLDGSDDRLSLARALVVIGGTVTLQLGFAGGARALQAAGGWAAEAATSRAEILTAARAAQAAHEAMLRRYGAIQDTTSVLLAALAEGTADPGDPAVRRRCAIQAARLRRLLVAHDGGPDSLLDELRACGDVAERRGVLVEMSAVGRVPPLPAPVRRALAEPAIQALSAARSRGRITVAALPGEVVVSVLVDAGGTAPDGGGGAGVRVHWHHTVGESWMEARVELQSAEQPSMVGRSDRPGQPIDLS